MTEKKITKRELFTAVKAELVTPELQDFIQTCIDQLDKRAEKTKERAAAKKVAGDALREDIFNVLGDTPRTIPEILAALGDEELTPNKITARLTQLVQLEKVGKEKVKTESGEKMAYFVIG